MIKNWLVKTKQIKKKESGFINHVNYLDDKNRASHYHSKITILNDSSKNILNEFDKRKEYRRENSLRGGGVSNYATSFVMSLPSDLDPQPSAEDWKRIAMYAVKKVAEKHDIDFKKLKSLTHVVLHDESESDDKHSHVHVLMSNVIDNEVVKEISQFSTTHAVKQSFNQSVKQLLKHDNMQYKPIGPVNQDVPLHVARAEKAEKAEKRAILAEKLFKKTVRNLKKLSDSYRNWFKSVRNELKEQSIENAEHLANEIIKVEESPVKSVSDMSVGLEQVIKQDEIELKAEEPQKVTSKVRKKRRRKRTI